MEPDLKSYLERFDQRLQAIQYKKGDGLWKSFLRGTMMGLGSIVGVAIALAIAGYILNAVGVIPGLRERASSWQETLDNLPYRR